MIGDECPGGSSWHPTRFFAAPNAVGNSAYSETPVPLGPRILNDVGPSLWRLADRLGPGQRGQAVTLRLSGV